MVFYVSPVRSTVSQYSDVDQEQLLFEPTLEQSVRSSVNLAFNDVGTQSYISAADKAEAAGGRSLSIEEYKESSYFRPSIGYMTGMTDGKAKILAEQHDSLEFDRNMQARATGARAVAGIGSALVAGVVEPRNLMYGAATFGVGAVIGSTARAGSRLKRILDARRMGAGYAAKAKLGALEGLVSAAAMEPGNRYAADILQDDYTMADSLFNVATSAILGTALEVTPKFIADRFARYGDKSKAMDIIVTEMDTAVEQLATGRRIEVGAVEKAYTGEISKKPVAERIEAVRQSVRYEETPEFKARFEGSKVVDENGKPLMVYHGTNKTFEFHKIAKVKDADNSYARDRGIGVFYSSKPEAAEFYAGYEGSPQTRPAFIKMERPYIHNYGGEAKRPAKIMEIYNKAIQSGSDGIIIKNIRDTPTLDSEDLYIAFSPTQIISALGADDADAIARRLDMENAKAISGHIKQQLDPNNDTAIDVMAINRLEDYEESLMVQKHIDELEKTNAYIDELNKMEAEGIIDSSELEVLSDAMAAIDVDKLQSAWEAARICLTRG